MPPEMPDLINKGIKIMNARENLVNLGSVRLVPLAEESWY